MKKIFAVSMIIVLMFTLLSCADNVVKGSVVRESTYGNAELDIMPQKMLEKINVGETVIVKIGDFEEEMPFVDELIAEDGKIQLFFDREDWNLNICIYNERFFEKYGIEIADKVEIRKK